MDNYLHIAYHKLALWQSERRVEHRQSGFRLRESEQARDRQPPPLEVTWERACADARGGEKQRAKLRRARAISALLSPIRMMLVSYKTTFVLWTNGKNKKP